MNRRRYAIIILLSVALIAVTTGAYLVSNPGQSQIDSTDRVGYWKGVTATEDINTQDGYVLKENSEEFVYRAIARTEEIRDEPFQQDITVEIVTREEHREDNPFQQQARSYETWTNTIWSGMLVIPRQESVQEIQTEFANENVLAYYLISQNELVVVAEEETESGYYIDEKTLVHELGHALQDQRMGLNRDPINSEVTTIRQTNLSLIEGEATLYEQKFEDMCRTQWDCVETPLQHRSEAYDGTYPGYRQLSVAPYDVGLSYLNENANGNWDQVDEIYESNSLYRSRQLHYETEDPRTVVDVQDISNNRWSLTTGRGLNGKEMLGLHGMAAILTHYDQEYGVEVPYPEQTRTEYKSPFLEQYESDSFAPYTDPSSRQGFVWTVHWSSPQSAQQFEEIYISAIEETGGTTIEDPSYSIPSESVDNHTVLSGGGEFQGSYSITRNESTVTITSAPLVEDLQEIRPTQLEPRIVNEQSTTTLPEPSYEITSVEDRESEEIETTEQGPIPDSIIVILRILAVVACVSVYVYIDEKVRQ